MRSKPAASAPTAPAPAVHPAPAEPTGAVAGGAPWFSRAPPALEEALPYGNSWFYVPLLLSAAGMLRSEAAFEKPTASARRGGSASPVPNGNGAG